MTLPSATESPTNQSKTCPFCAESIRLEAIRCRFCGADLVPSDSPSRGAEAGDVSVAAHVIILLGCLAMVVGPFLPWATLGVFSASGVQKTDNEALALVFLGAAGVLPSILSLVRRHDTAKWSPFVVGGLALALSLYYYAGLSSQLADAANDFASPALGAGIYVCLAASITVLLGTMGFARRRAG